jgi:hypothetical protein
MVAIWIVLGMAAIVGLERLARWMEARAGIYWRREHGGSGSLGAAFLEVQSIFEPGNQHVIEAQRDEDSDDEASGDPPKAG